jgi:putative transposase
MTLPWLKRRGIFLAKYRFLLWSVDIAIIIMEVLVVKINPIHHNHSVCLLTYHFVTSPKMRHSELTDDITVDLFKQAIAKYPLQIHVGEIMPDHIHLMIQAPATLSPANIAKIVKGCSSRLIKQIVPTFSGWSTGYYISTTGGTAIDVVKAYIENQKNQ